jgi:hypothetical protein
VARVRRAALALTTALLLVALGACSDDGDDAAPTSSDTTTSAPAETSTTGDSTTTQPDAPAIALRGDGLGVVELGSNPDDAVAAVTAELGAPTVDTGWESSSSSYGTCPGERIRGVEWGGLVLLFTDGTTDHGSGEHLFTWRVTSATPPIATVEGLGYGATGSDAEELYAGMVERVPAEDPFPAFLRIAGEGGQITAYLDDTDTITNLEAGTGCGE